MARFRSLAVAAILALALAAAGCGSAATATGRIENLPAGEAADVLTSTPGAVLLDIRTPEEYREGHLAGSVNIDFYAADFADQIGALDRDATYVVYCRSDNRSGAAMDLFRDLGFGDVVEVDGGIVAWVEAGLPVVR